MQPLQFPVRIRLNRIKRDVLVLLGMPPVFLAVKKGHVGIQNVMNAIAEGGNKTGAISLKSHIAFYQAIVDLGKVFKGNAVGFKLFGIGNQAPDQVAGRYC